MKLSPILLSKDAVLCLLKNVPVVGTAVEIVQTVEQRYESLRTEERMGRIEDVTNALKGEMSDFTRRMQALVGATLADVIRTLRDRSLNGASLETTIRNIRDMKAQGWHPNIFEGLLEQSPHWAELRSAPQNYGDVLDDHQPVDPQKIQVIIDREKKRILQLTPFAFHHLLLNQSGSAPEPCILSADDLWALPSDNAGNPAETTNSIGMRFVRIRPGTFHMGSHPDAIGYNMQNGGNGSPHRPGKDELRHQVTLTRHYDLGIFPIRQCDFDRVMGYNPSRFLGANLPVDSVNWFECQEFCENLTALPAERSARRTYRLPTEAEWEYACRASSTGPYPFGDRVHKDQANLGMSKTTDVGSYPPNAWGLYDMVGNVNEWCADWYAPYDPSHAVDPRGPANGVKKVMRGDSWYGCGSRGGRSSGRYGCPPLGESSGFPKQDLNDRKSKGFGIYGFRVVCEIQSA